MIKYCASQQTKLNHVGFPYVSRGDRIGLVARKGRILADRQAGRQPSCHHHRPRGTSPCPSRSKPPFSLRTISGAASMIGIATNVRWLSAFTPSCPKNSAHAHKPCAAGRRHPIVWTRIDPNGQAAIGLPHFLANTAPRTLSSSAVQSRRARSWRRRQFFGSAPSRSCTRAYKHPPRSDRAVPSKFPWRDRSAYDRPRSSLSSTTRMRIPIKNPGSLLNRSNGR